ncbi:MAG TPA: glycosyltransferase [Candidatus Paceibacterota bacterium]|nr:glycosyltransferase [Candidatus Paceibacterota bacterium]
MGGAQVIIDPDEHTIKELVNESPASTIHVMAGARWTRLGNRALFHCMAAGARMGIMSESPDPRGLLSIGRRIRYALERCRYGYAYRFVLAMGEIGISWFRRCGYPNERIFPFAYITDSPPPAELSKPVNGETVLYVGQLIPRKGLDILLHAFAAMADNIVRLQLQGDGSEQNRLTQIAKRLGIQSRVEWLGSGRPSDVRKHMCAARLIVLPSRHDGWGAVVNESLMAGTPVVCSSACGAAELIRYPWLGSVFQKGSADDLTRVLRHWVELGPRTPAERERVRAWSDCISGPAVAKYFEAILDHVYDDGPRPTAPWRMPLKEGGL